MRNLVYTFLLSLLGILPSHACDVCGCGNGGSFFGILPQSHMRFAGVRYRIKNYESHLNSTFFRARENFQTAELWARFYPFKRTQLMVFVPYSLNTQTLYRTETPQRINGLGDVSALFHYNIVNTFWDSTSHKVDQTLLIGGGVKAPTGKFRYVEDGSEVANANFQLGTGSVDFVLNAIYNLRYQNWGANVDVSYKINTTNPNQYRFANRTSGSISVFRTVSLSSLTLMPNVGVYAERFGYDTKNGTKNTFTGGVLSTANVGFELYYKKISAGVTYQTPLYQHLSDGDLKLKNTTTTHITFLF
ncbi:hypothetical protein P1X15_08945 [Runella sp. MFBS21]|uniref:hypothetical protein n=1 Tax=Runella sp. MFBS21 TaxID=3034018 RepID=UPI0023F9CC25|nr:hypothetical protein [Runella sp. MFBS21]MDF7817722.1 hypothetical protein [Runella sp. MFBS21]